VIFGRGRFHELVQRQLDLFEEDQASVLAEAHELEARWTNATAEESEALYGEFQLVVDAFGELLYDARETYAATLDERTASDYRAAFDRAAVKRFRRYATFLEEDG